jgi:signal transduction histidine kinase
VGSAAAVLALGLALVQVCKSKQPFFWRNALNVGMMLLFLGGFLSDWRRAKYKAMEEKITLPPLSKRPKTQKQTFFWQGVLILLPMALMAGFGLWALWRERNSVEQEARQRASEILQALPADFGSRVALRMTEFSLAYSWLQNQQKVLSAWPDSKEQQWWATNILLAELPVWQAAFPALQPQSVFPLDYLSLNTNGELRFSNFTNPPAPPDWFVALTADQRDAWTALRKADDTAEPVSNVVQLARQFLETKPPAPARANVEFIQLRAESQTEPATNAVSDLLRFFSRHYFIQSVTVEPLSETGVPLSTLALAEALRRARECGATESLWTTLQTEIELRPSILTPNLLDEAAPLAARDSRLVPALDALRRLWKVHQTQQEFAGAVKQAGKVSGLVTTNFWIAAMGQKWFCIVHPEFVPASISNQTTLVPGNASLRLDSHPEPVVARGFAEALRDAKATLPGYFALSAELEGHQVALPSPWQRKLAGQDAGEVLAENQFYMSLTGSSHQWDPSMGRFTNTIWFETLPSHPRFTLQIHLDNRSLLYAKQRQRQLVFGSLIALSAVAALIGFVAALHSFRRQQQLNEMKSNFVSSVSHELRAPIASVRLMAENLEREKVPEPHKQKEYFGFIVQECRRLSSLIENVLDFSRIDQGRKQYEFEPTNLVALVNQTVTLMQLYAAEKGVSLVWETSNIQHPTSNIELNVDGKAIQQALVNLIDNAIRHSPKGEKVAVGIEVRGRRSEDGSQKPEPGMLDATRHTPHAATLSLSVSDHGPGIPPEEHEKIFERFYRRGSELRRETQGVGIGLSIVKHIIEAHGGRVIVRSAPGDGSRFTIELPIQQ